MRRRGAARPARPCGPTRPAQDGIRATAPSPAIPPVAARAAKLFVCVFISVFPARREFCRAKSRAAEAAAGKFSFRGFAHPRTCTRALLLAPCQGACAPDSGLSIQRPQDRKPGFHPASGGIAAHSQRERVAARPMASSCKNPLNTGVFAVPPPPLRRHETAAPRLGRLPPAQFQPCSPTRESGLQHLGYFESTSRN